MDSEINMNGGNIAQTPDNRDARGKKETKTVEYGKIAKKYKLKEMP